MGANGFLTENEEGGRRIRRLVDDVLQLEDE